MAEILLSHPTRIAELQTNYCLKRIIGQHTLGKLQEDGVIPKVNPESTQSAVDCLAAYGIMVESIQIKSLDWPEPGKAFVQELVVPRTSQQNTAQRKEPRPESIKQPASNTNSLSHAWM
jgi:regulator of protease activity HflC (stomatin/prohibitin superfamily)